MKVSRRKNQRTVKIYARQYSESRIRYDREHDGMSIYKSPCEHVCAVVAAGRSYWLSLIFLVLIFSHSFELNPSLSHLWEIKQKPLIAFLDRKIHVFSGRHCFVDIRNRCSPHAKFKLFIFIRNDAILKPQWVVFYAGELAGVGYQVEVDFPAFNYL